MVGPGAAAATPASTSCPRAGAEQASRNAADPEWHSSAREIWKAGRFILFWEHPQKEPSAETRMFFTCCICCTCRDDTETQVKPPHADASTQTDLPSTEGAAQDPGSREQQDLEAPRRPEGRGGCQGYRCAQLGELLKQMALLLEKLIRQHRVQESRRETDELHYAQRVSVQQQRLEAGQGEGKFASSPD